MRNLTCILAVVTCATAAAAAAPITLSNNGLTIKLEPGTGAYSFWRGGRQVIAADGTAGIMLDGAPVTFKNGAGCSATRCVLHGTTSAGAHLTLTIRLSSHRADLIAKPEKDGSDVRFQTAGAAPAYGLADHAVYQAKFQNANRHEFFNTDVTGFSDDEFRSGQGISRLVSNFIIYPKHDFAVLLIDPTLKVVQTSRARIVQGVRHANGDVHMLYFFGDPHAIYAEYLKARNEAGYKFWMPKYQAFGVGWEAFGALGWDTNTNTVRDSVDHYLKLGYPLTWMVIGSGFWPSQPETMHETTSFGYWDKQKYPDPKALVQHFKDEHLGVMLGLRITFIVGGPYSKEGSERGYFLKDQNGKTRVFKGSWPKQPYYLLDAQNKAAVDWYMSLVAKWQAYGINGWKEDFYGYGHYKDLRDDKVDPTNDRLMAQKQLVIERNGYLSSNGDLHRINDFNYNQNQDRGPVNALAYAYSGFPFVYPDIVGGTFGENHFSTTRTAAMQTYMMRNAQWASLHSSMGMGEPPWTFNQQVADVMLKAAKFHQRIAPYLYSNARRAYADGYPWTMTPLPIAFPHDAAAYGRENAKDRGYEWLIGDAILATPLYGDDYATATTRDIYLPAGTWMDFDTGKIYTGSQMLKSFDLPAGKTPVFIGGTGVTLEHVDDTDRICVYPVTTASQATLTLPNDARTITVKIRGLKPSTTWKSIYVTDANGKPVASRTEGHGFSFVPAAGRTYIVRAKE
ncbi:MAG: hypothetical protein JSS87_00270 [Acidobacteria bacterium]|nr:hypothetical protein [Acidobacteriota bacterium]